jgi:DNA-binding MarR family transcriptional regulator
MSPNHNNDFVRRILEELDAGGELSQRTLANRLGIALGRANQLIRSLIGQGWLRGLPAEGHRIRYVVTPEGAAARARMSREHLGRALASYGTAHDRVRERLEACTTNRAAGGSSFRPAVALYGTGEAARIAFACAAELGVQLVGFIDENPRESFLGLPVRAPSHLTSMALDGRAFDWLLVATLADQDAIRGRLLELGFPLDRVSWL